MTIVKVDCSKLLAIVKLDGILARFAMVISRPLLEVAGNFPSYDLQGAAPVVRLT